LTALGKNERGGPSRDLHGDRKHPTAVYAKNREILKVQGARVRRLESQLKIRALRVRRQEGFEDLIRQWQRSPLLAA
jgi:hypothetical protein